MAQNHSKKEVLMFLAGKGSARESRRVWKKWDGRDGKLREKAEYLGGVRSWDGREVAHVKARCQAAHCKLLEFKGLWNKRDVDITTKEVFFVSVVLSTLWSGLEASVLTE